MAAVAPLIALAPRGPHVIGLTVARCRAPPGCPAAAWYAPSTGARRL